MSRLVMKALTASPGFLVIALLAGCAGAQTSVAPGATPGPQMVLYTDNWTTTTPMAGLPSEITIAVEAFGTIAPDGTASNPVPPGATKPAGQKWLLSFGGANANWGVMQSASAPNQDVINRFASTAARAVSGGGFDGMDLDIEDIADPATPGSTVSADTVTAIVQAVRGQLGTAPLLTISPQSTYVYPGQTFGNGWNEMVPVLNKTSSMIDYVLLQVYNNWPDSTADDYVTVYNNWVNPFNQAGVDYQGLPASKLVMGLLASTQAGTNGYLSPSDANAAISKIRAQHPDFAGVMIWDDHWDALAGRALSSGISACVLRNICPSGTPSASAG